MTWQQQIDIEGQGSWTARRGGYGAKNCIHGNFVTLGLGHASPHPRFLLFRWTPIQFAFSSWISTTSQVPQLTWQCPFSKGHTTSAELPGTMKQLARECHCCDRSEVYYYTPSSNSWTHMVNMPYSTLDVAAAIIKQKNEDRWLTILRRDHKRIYYYNLDTSSGFHHVTDVDLKFSTNMPMLSLTPNSAFMLGAWSNHYGHSLKNFWVYNSECTLVYWYNLIGK